MRCRRALAVLPPTLSHTHHTQRTPNTHNNRGSAPAVEDALQEGFGLVSIDTWLAVIPQIIARIHTNNVQVGVCVTACVGFGVVVC